MTQPTLQSLVSSLSTILTSSQQPQPSTPTMDQALRSKFPSMTGSPRRIGILTSGGDAPGMNAAIRAIVRMSLLHGHKPYAIREGYEGLIQGGAMIHPLSWTDVRGWLSKGGTLIGSARSERFKVREGRLLAAKHLVENEIEGILVIGGDGSLTGAEIFKTEWPSLIQELVRTGEIEPRAAAKHPRIHVVGLLGSIDNDFGGTDATIGCYSALTRICEAIDDVFDTATSHRRAFVVEVMGRNCGWLALMAAIATGADWLFIPERPPRPGWEDDMCSIIAKNRDRGKRSSVVVVAEGAQDADLNHITSFAVKDVQSKRLGLDTRATVLGHVQRGGAPCAYDRRLATLQGVIASMELLMKTPISPSSVVVIREDRISNISLDTAVARTRQTNEWLKAKDFEAAVRHRDPEFLELHRAYRRLNTADHPDMMLPVEKRLRIAIIHVGKPAAGMNPATRAAVAYCLSRGHTPIAIHNGFRGLCRHNADQPVGSVREMGWPNAHFWNKEGGSELGTNVGHPSEAMETTAKCFAQHKFDALLIIGGTDGYRALSELRQARAQYSAFRIPMALLPASMSNNVPGTEFSLGSDTSMNALIRFCEVVRQSASSSRHRVYVVEAQGGNSGYLATAAALCTGAMTVYTPERGIKLQRISDDIKYLRQRFAKDHGASESGKLIIRNENTSTMYSTKMIADIINDEAEGRFEAEGVVPGHFQQGGAVSPIDRIRAFRMAIRCLEHIERYTGKAEDELIADEQSAVVVGIKDTHVTLSNMGGPSGLEANEEDWKRHMPPSEPWHTLPDLVDVLSGRATMEDV